MPPSSKHYREPEDLKKLTKPQEGELPGNASCEANPSPDENGIDTREFEQLIDRFWNVNFLNIEEDTDIYVAKIFISKDQRALEKDFLQAKADEMNGLKRRKIWKIVK